MSVSNGVVFIVFDTHADGDSDGVEPGCDIRRIAESAGELQSNCGRQALAAATGMLDTFCPLCDASFHKRHSRCQSTVMKVADDGFRHS